jgi:hypothetical protein
MQAAATAAEAAGARRRHVGNRMAPTLACCRRLACASGAVSAGRCLPCQCEQAPAKGVFVFRDKVHFGHIEYLDVN